MMRVGMNRKLSQIPISFRIEAWLLERLLYHFAGAMVQDKWWREGMELEQERIIKLLEDYSDGELLVMPTGEISALIKGEQK